MTSHDDTGGRHRPEVARRPGGSQQDTDSTRGHDTKSDGIDVLIEGSSLGTPGASSMRNRTSMQRAEELVAKAFPADNPAGLTESRGWDLPRSHLLPDAIAAFVAGELSVGAQERAAAHVARCRNCADEVADQRHARTAGKRMDTPSSSAGFLARLRTIRQHAELGDTPDDLATTENGHPGVWQRPDQAAAGSSPTTAGPAGDFWGLLDQTQRDVILAGARIREFRAGTGLMAEADRFRSVLVIFSGLIKVTWSGLDGDESVFSVCGPGDLVGEIIATDIGTRTAEMTAVDAVTALWLSADQFAEIVRRHPDIAVAVSQVIVGRLRTADLRRRKFLERNADARIADLLVDLADRYGVSTSDGVVLPLSNSQQDIADLVSEPLPTVTQTLQTLRDAGVISTTRRSLTIHQVAVLRDLPRSLAGARAEAPMTER
ncbi:Crp/Fnr family transcriptional regulator [Saccharothrix sp. AJ9571]|nr:Crp/Fnr family transcriptional regulator [Saccharothrix sp. AJ9571]